MLGELGAEQNKNAHLESEICLLALIPLSQQPREVGIVSPTLYTG